MLLLGSILIGCSDQESPTAANDEALTTLSKAGVVEYQFDVNLGLEAPYEDCTTGADMQNHGITRAHIRVTTTPSGNLIMKGWVDYDAYGAVTLENLATGEIWTLANGHNPFGRVIKENGYFLAHYHWNELYRGPNGQVLHILLKGHIKFDKDGNLIIFRRSYTCR